MNKDLMIFRYFCAILFVSVLFSCATFPPKPSQSEYLDVDYRRFISGVYVDELANKYVKLDCRFSSIFAGTLPGGYSPTRYMSFLAISPEGFRIESPGHLTIVVPKDIADIVFTLRHGQSIKVYGLAVPIIIRTVGGRVYKSLIIEMDLIEKQ